MPQPVARNLSHARFEKGAPRISRKHKLRSRESNCAVGHDGPRFRALLNMLPLSGVALKRSATRYIVEDAPLSLIRRATISFPTVWSRNALFWA